MAEMWQNGLIMAEEKFIDMFNRIHNPDYYYGRNKYEKKKTEKKNKDRNTSKHLRR